MHTRPGKGTWSDRDDYREVLWAVADRHDDERNVKRVYEESYQRIMLACQRIPLELDEFLACVAGSASRRPSCGAMCA